MDLAVSRQTIYVADSSAGLRAIDVSDPENPSELGACDTPGYAYEVALSGDIAHVADGNGGLRVVSVSDPTHPLELGHCETPGYALGMALSGDTAYLADGDGGLRIVDVSDPENPSELGSYDTPGYPYGVAVAADVAYVAADEGGLRVVSVSDPANPDELASYDTPLPGHAEGLCVSGTTVYVADGQGGLRVVDVSDPARPVEMSSWGTFARGCTATEDTVYAVSGSYLAVLDVSNPAHPTWLGYFPTTTFTEDVAVSGTTAYLANGDHGLRIIDVSDPENPTELGTYDTLGHTWDAAVSEGIAYVADGSKGLRVVDVSDPAHPTELGHHDTYWTKATDVVIDGTMAYVSDEFTGLRILDVSDPSDPILLGGPLGSYNPPGSVRGLALSGSAAYLAARTAGLWVVDASDPEAVVELGSYDTPGEAFEVVVRGDIMYVADGSCGLIVLRYPADNPTPTPPSTSTPISTPTPPSTSTPAPTHTPTASATPLVTNTPTETPQPTGTATPTPTETASPSPTGTASATPSSTPSPSVTPTTTPSPTETATSTPTSTPSPSGTPSPTPTPTKAGTPAPGDPYEADDTCAEASAIATDGTVQRHTFHDNADKDWVEFDAVAGTSYLIEAQIPVTSSANVVAELHDDCVGLPLESQDYAFSPGIRLTFEAPTSAPYYVRLNNHEADIAGPDVAYRLSVRALSDEPSPGALVLVAGKRHRDDPLQDNIHAVTNAVYRLFKGRDYGDERITYLATDLNLDADGDGWSDVDAQPEGQKLAWAITQWAADKVGPERALTLFLMDHGGYDRFYLNGAAETVSPDEVDGWLDALEAAVPGVKVNVIVEACHSGSFIDLVKSVSGPGRVVITSTGAHALAYASQDGAVFSDALLAALERDMSLYGSFAEARASARQAHPGQVAWLDDDGDGLPNETEDGEEAQRRGFAYAGTFADEQWPPYVAWAQVRDVTGDQGVIEAEVRDDSDVSSVYAVIYKPSYQPPDPAETEEMPQEDLPTVTLLDPDDDDVYSGLYEGFGEQGTYRVVIHARDDDLVEARPLAIETRTHWSLYLPLVIRHWPPAPESASLDPIDNPGGDGSYTVQWSAVKHAASYVLQEARTGDFGDAVTVYEGPNTSHAITGRGAARYRYRVQARNIWQESEWSSIKWVDVLWEAEPNDERRTEANGPIVSGLTYYGTFPTPAEHDKDYYAINLASPHTIDIWLTNIPAGQNYDVALWDLTSWITFSAEEGQTDEHISTDALPAGRYFIQVYHNDSGGSTQPYHLRVDYD
jgi:hypothetical protein